MSNIINEPKITNHMGALIFRVATEHRATWLATIMEEAEKAGVEPEEFLRKGIFSCGIMHGENYKAKLTDKEDIGEFGDQMFGEIGKNAYEVDIVRKEHDCLELEFHYCPLLKAWQKLGYSDERLARLCDIAMDGDRGIAAGLGYDIEITDTLAKGCPTCKIAYRRRKKEGE